MAVNSDRDRPRREAGDMVAGMVAPVADWLDRTVGWDRLPPKLGILTLLGLRHRLRKRNLYDTRQPEKSSGKVSPARTLDGRFTDPDDAGMGAVGTPFGRNAPPVFDQSRSPAPEDVSETLLKRTEFFPAETLNLLAAAWVQFEVHDWFAHQKDSDDEAYADRKKAAPDGAPVEPPRLRAAAAADGRPKAFLSEQTHWWDASQLYGAQKKFIHKLRSEDGKVKDDDALLELMTKHTRASGTATTAPIPNLWLGTALLHLLFAKEHNAICERLQRAYPRWSDDRLFEKARLINAAVMAKIHTVEWTPAIIAHPVAARGIQATWWGVLDSRRFGRRFRDEVLSGIPGSRPNHDGAAYALTEEFVTVYRLHALIPDEVTFRRIGDASWRARHEFLDLVATDPEPERPMCRLKTIGAVDALYSLGTANPGAITLHNYPAFFSNFPQVGGPPIDVGAADIRRTRETGVPRYNDFRRVFRLRPASSFDDIANGNPQWAREIRDLYGDLEEVDLLIGMFGERKPRGFAFSDTAFRVFLLMAARRLRSDRFFTTDYTEAVYTPEGFRWIDDATFAGVLLRHYPELRSVLPPGRNLFMPWQGT